MNSGAGPGRYPVDRIQVNEAPTRQRQAETDVQVYPSFESLPGRVAAFVDEAGRRSFFDSAAWYRTLFEITDLSGDEPRIYAAEPGGRPVAVLITRARERPGGRLAARTLRSCSEMMYSSIYRPILDPRDGLEGLRDIVRTIARESPPFDVIRLDNLDPEQPAFAALAAAFRESGMLVQRFANFGNWYEEVEGQTFDDYLARRSAQTRYLIGRRTRKLERTGRGRFVLVTGGPDLEMALAEYERVDARSWKPPEPFPRIIPALARVAARAGVLRLGLLYVDDDPAAAQIWIVSGGRATILRLSYDERFGKLAVGTVLTRELMRHVIEVDRVREVDIGRGDDPYKSKWFGRRRERWGILAFNRRTAKGWLAAARHLGGHEAARVARRLLGPGGPLEFLVRRPPQPQPPEA